MDGLFRVGKCTTWIHLTNVLWVEQPVGTGFSTGALAYDPVIGSHVYAQQEAPAVPFLLQNNNRFRLNASFVAHLEALHESCDYSDFISEYLTFPPSHVQPPKYFDYNSLPTTYSTIQQYIPRPINQPPLLARKRASNNPHSRTLHLILITQPVFRYKTTSLLCNKSYI
ncbi:hypothetical protein EAF00_007316 [Botryotinia globosa]|nr:hypothetical protein EAF00_007316 [Botryotinia globosa]